MCEVGNLIDLTPGEKPNTEETRFKTSEDSMLPYDPFESLEKEACAKGMALKKQIRDNLSAAEAHDIDLKKGPLQLPASDLFEGIILNKNQHMLSTESPLKFVEDDDLSSSLKFERDLQMMRIPFLDALSKAELESSPRIHNQNPKINKKQETIPADTDDPPKSNDMGQVLEQLRALIHQEVAKNKWHLFEAIIEPIAALIGSGQDSDSNPSPNGSCPEVQKEEAEAPEASVSDKHRISKIVPPRDVKSTVSLFNQTRYSFAAISNPPTKIGLNPRSLLDRLKSPSTSESAVKSSGTTGTKIPTRTMIPTPRSLKPPTQRTSDSWAFPKKRITDE